MKNVALAVDRPWALLASFPGARPSASSAPCALRVIIKCAGGKTEASVFSPPHLIITRNAHGAEEAEGLGTRLGVITSVSTLNHSIHRI